MRLFVSLSFHYLLSTPQQTKGSNGFFNQIQSLLNAIQIARYLKRKLVVDGFFPDFERNETIPLGHIIDLSSFSSVIQDGFGSDVPRKSRFLRDFCCPSLQKWLHRIQQVEQGVESLFVGCCFYYCLDSSQFKQDLSKLKFQPQFYEWVQPFLNQHPSFHAVHYRLESDFSNHFYSQYGFSSPGEFEKHLWQILKNSMKKWSSEKVLVLCAEKQKICSTYPLEAKFTPIFFQLPPETEKEVQSKLGLGNWKRVREIYALFDFLLCSSEYCKEFIGVNQSSFSRGLALKRLDKSNNLLHLSPTKI